MENDPPAQNARDPKRTDDAGGWWPAFVALFATTTSDGKAAPAGSGGEYPAGDAPAFDVGGADAGGGGGGGGGD